MEELQATKSNTPPWVLLTFFKFTNGNKWCKASDLYTFFILHCYWSTISQTMSGKSLYCSSTPTPTPHPPSSPRPFLAYFYTYFRPRLSKASQKIKKKNWLQVFHTIFSYPKKNGSLNLVSSIYHQIFISHQIIALQKL